MHKLTQFYSKHENLVYWFQANEDKDNLLEEHTFTSLITLTGMKVLTGRPERLGGGNMFSLCLRRFSPGTPGNPCPKYMLFTLIGNTRLHVY